MRRPLLLSLSALPLLLLTSACSDDPASTGATGGAGTGGATVSSSTSASSTTTTTNTATTSTTSGGPTSDIVPANAADLFAYLQAGGYLAFSAESAPHPSAGPHGGKVRTYLNAPLQASLAKGNTEHPMGAAVVKELYGNGTTVTGWAAAVKTEAQSNSGNGWYWFEVYSTTDASGAYQGQGLSLCTSCHENGKDYVLTPYPLQ